MCMTKSLDKAKCWGNRTAALNASAALVRPTRSVRRRSRFIYPTANKVNGLLGSWASRHKDSFSDLKQLPDCRYVIVGEGTLPVMSRGCSSSTTWLMAASATASKLPSSSMSARRTISGPSCCKPLRENKLSNIEIIVADISKFEV
ncbi:uncharacterized protein [Zea mays]|uniref:uncharacterized protein isoform X1 n=1 Tax=Zea mays TaxID=4577 RepID=UPI0009A9A9AE|nr:uncharacterized protein LOC103640536 isoform X1 [Zea mays]|eukprot:XP_020402779.1 uncharacterized protein LOC103640536 isoform X1 [Zea mays]